MKTYKKMVFEIVFCKHLKKELSDENCWEKWGTYSTQNICLLEN